MISNNLPNFSVDWVLYDLSTQPKFLGTEGTTCQTPSYRAYPLQLALDFQAVAPVDLGTPLSEQKYRNKSKLERSEHRIQHRISINGKRVQQAVFNIKLSKPSQIASSASGATDFV